MAEFLIRKTGSLRKNVDEWTADRGRFQAKRAFGRKVARADLGVRCRVELHAKSERIEKPEGRQRPGVLGRSPRRQAAATRRREEDSKRTRTEKIRRDAAQERAAGKANDQNADQVAADQNAGAGAYNVAFGSEEAWLLFRKGRAMKWIPLERVGELEERLRLLIRSGTIFDRRDALAMVLGLYGLRGGEARAADVEHLHVTGKCSTSAARASPPRSPYKPKTMASASRRSKIVPARISKRNRSSSSPTRSNGIHFIALPFLQSNQAFSEPNATLYAPAPAF